MRLEEAASADREALKEGTRERAPLACPGTQMNLGNALSSLGERENKTEKLEEAVLAYREALKERTRERVPLDWATSPDEFLAMRFRGSASARAERQSSKRYSPPRGYREFRAGGTYDRVGGNMFKQTTRHRSLMIATLAATIAVGVLNARAADAGAEPGLRWQLRPNPRADRRAILQAEFARARRLA